MSAGRRLATLGEEHVWSGTGCDWWPQPRAARGSGTLSLSRLVLVGFGASDPVERGQILIAGGVLDALVHAVPLRLDHCCAVSVGTNADRMTTVTSGGGQDMSGGDFDGGGGSHF